MAECRLRRLHITLRDGKSVGNLDRCCDRLHRFCCKNTLADKVFQARRHVAAQPGKGLPFLPRLYIHALPKLLNLCRVHHSRMIVLVTRKRKAIALYRIGNKQGGAVIIGAVKGIHQRSDAMPAQIGHQRSQIIIVKTIDQLSHMGLAADIRDQPRTPCRPALICQYGKFCIGAVFDPILQRFPAGSRKCRTLQLAIF